MKIEKQHSVVGVTMANDDVAEERNIYLQTQEGKVYLALTAVTLSKHTDLIQLSVRFHTDGEATSAQSAVYDCLVPETWIPL